MFPATFTFDNSLQGNTSGNLTQDGIQLSYLNPIGNNNNAIDSFANGLAFDNGFNNDMQSLDFTFDTIVRIDSFVVGDQAFGGGTLNFKLNGITQEATDVSNLGTVNLNTPFIIQTSDTLTLENNAAGTDEFAITSFTVTNVPEPIEYRIAFFYVLLIMTFAIKKKSLASISA